MTNKKGKLVSRAFVNVEAKEGVLVGTPIVYNSPALIGGLFEEVISRGAIQQGAITKDTALYYNHNLNTKPLCRVRTGKLKLEDTADGIKMEAHLNLDRSDCNDLYLAVRDGDINKMSFCFRVEEDEWDFETNPELPRRTIKKISYIKEVSAVDEPAYETTDLYARRGEPVETDSEALESARVEYRTNVQSQEDDEQKGMTDKVETEPEIPQDEEANVEVSEDTVDSTQDTETVAEENIDDDNADNEARYLELEKEKALALLDI